MNLRRIGLAALAVGVAGLVRRRLKTRVDPGPDAQASTGAATAFSSDRVGPGEVVTDTGGAADAAVIADLGDPALGDPAVGAPAVGEDVALGEPTVIDAVGSEALDAASTTVEEGPPAATSPSDSASAELDQTAAEVPEITLPTVDAPAGSETESGTKAAETAPSSADAPAASVSGTEPAGIEPPTVKTPAANETQSPTESSGTEAPAPGSSSEIPVITLPTIESPGPVPSESAGASPGIEIPTVESRAASESAGASPGIEIPTVESRAASESAGASPGIEIPTVESQAAPESAGATPEITIPTVESQATPESAGATPEITIPTVDVPESEPSAATTDTPVIRIPTMPPAGTRRPVPPADSTESADTSSIGTADVPSVVLPAEVAEPVEDAAPEADDGIANMTAVEPLGAADLAQPAPAGPAFAPANPTPESVSQPGNVPAPTRARVPFWKRHRGWSIAGSVVLALMIVAVIAASVVRLPYYSLEPGSVYDTIGRVEAPGDLVSIPSGEIGFVTVAQTANITPWQWLDAKLDNNVRIRHEDDVRGDQSADELREADIRRMQVSKNSAVVVALRRLGFDLIVTPIGIEVAQVFSCTAADGTLGTGDLIIGVNGVDVRSGEQLVEQLMNQSIGDEVDLLIERIDPSNPTQSMRTDLVAITLGSADADCLPDDIRAEEPRPFIGIGTLPMFDEEFPIDIGLRTGTVSGPSAGLAFTLAIIDVLSEGELTNGLSVVATGSIDRDGNVGPVGGIQQKTVAAERSGADVFIVPKCCDNFVSRDDGEPLDIPSNYEEALLYADDMIVIGVDTLDEALLALGELGGDVDRFLETAAP